MLMMMGFYVLTVAHMCSCPFNIGSWGSPSGFHLQPPSEWVKPQGCHQEHLDTSVFFPMNAWFFCMSCIGNKTDQTPEVSEVCMCVSEGFSLNDGSPIFGSFQKTREVQVPEKQWEHWPRGSDPMMSLAHSQHCKLFFGVKITRNGAGRSNMWLTNW